jgi:dihydroorotase
MRVWIKGGRVIDPANGVDTVLDVYIADGKIAAVGSRPDGCAVEEAIDASGWLVFPGLVDLCARLREPGQEHKGTIASETRAAAAGGVTTLFCPPDSNPIIDTPAVVNLIRERAEAAGYCRVMPIGALTQGLGGSDLSEMHALKEAGCLAVSNGYAAIANTLVMRRALEYAASHDLRVIIRPSDPWLGRNGCVHEGPVASRLGLPAIPSSAETVAVAQALALVDDVRGPVHFGQLSTARAVEMIAEAQGRGLPVTADVAMHHLHCTENELEGFNAHAHVIPPFRTEADRDALRGGLAGGVIAAVCSDHQPHDLDAKLDAFPATEPGLATLETLLPSMLRLVDGGVMEWGTAITRLTAGPAEAMGLPAGSLKPGADADLCLFDPTALWHVQQRDWQSQGRNTPYWQTTCKGRVMQTFRAGRKVFSAQFEY